MKRLSNKIKVIGIILLTIIVYSVLIYSIRSYPTVKSVVKIILFIYMMLIIFVFILGNMFELFNQNVSQFFANIFWHMAYICLLLAPLGLAVI